MASKSTLKAVCSCQLFALAAAALTIGSSQPPTGYELSLYAAYPWHVWVLLGGVVVAAGVVSVMAEFEDGSKHNWLYVWAPALLAMLLVFWLPLLRGYQAYGRGDTLTHIGYARDVLLTGHVDESNGYPALHLLAVVYYMATGLKLPTVMMVLPGIFALLYVIWVQRLAAEVFRSKPPMLFATILALMFTFERVQQFSPFNGSIFVPPLFLVLYYRSRNDLSLAYSIVFVVLVVALPTVHIFVISALIILLGCLVVADRAYRAAVKGRYESISSVHERKTFLPAILLMAVLTAFWGIERYDARVSWSIFSVVSLLVETGVKSPFREGPSILLAVTSTLGKANLSAFEYTYLLWFRSRWLYFFVSPMFLVPAVLLLHRFGHLSLSERTRRRSVQFLLVYLVFAFLSAVSLLSSFIFSYGRILRYAVLASIIINCLAFWKLREYVDLKGGDTARRAFSMAVSLFVVVMLISSLFTIHWSPISLTRNSQVTPQEFESSEWWYEYHSPVEQRFGLVASLYSPRRLDHARTGTIRRVPTDTYQNAPIPDAFGYEGNETIRASIPNTERTGPHAYMIFSEVDRLSYQRLFKSVWPVAHRWQTRYVERLHADPTANKVYTNEEVTVWLIPLNATANKSSNSIHKREFLRTDRARKH
ncbi:hypothetical protein [Haladaptatus sp. NG-SE-30]